MSKEIYGGLDISLAAAAAYTAKQYYAVDVDSSGNAILCSAAGQRVLGILQDAPASGAQGCIRVQGVTKWVAGDVVAKGAAIKTDSSGRCVTAQGGYVNTSDTGAAQDPVVGSYASGIALEAAGAAGDVISVVLLQMGVLPTTAA